MGGLARTEEDAVKIAKKIDGDVAMKIVSPDILHKSDASGVMLNIGDDSQVRAAFASIMENARNYDPDADIKGVLVGPMAAKGLEIIIGTKIDEQFGPVIMYGPGGIMVEIMKDVTFWVLPVSPVSCRKMIEDTRSSVILNGIRGQKAYDKKSLQKLLGICSEIVESYPDIQEMDLNPVLLYEQGLDVVDARIILK
ncbi:MAG: acetate--CoA ligase family protein [Thermodesulfobacteriota bacterium]|nr:acetate--CoA ligase family protein [Thermodesulfobacteriota bacterium]